MAKSEGVRKGEREKGRREEKKGQKLAFRRAFHRCCVLSRFWRFLECPDQAISFVVYLNDNNSTHVARL